VILGVAVASWTQADLDNLKAAIASGVLSVTYDGPPRRSVTYHDLDKMRALRAEMEREVQAAAGTPTTTYRRVRFRKGFRDGE
jgi:hypothetical protein